MQSTKDLADAIEDACKKVFDDAVFARKLEKYFPAEKPVPGSTRDSSYVDAWMSITVRGVRIDIVSDTYTPKTDMMPDAGEERRFAKLQRNLTDHNRVIVRMPKPWALGLEINKESLSEFTKELCEQIKKMLDRGEFGPDKDKLRLDRLFKDLVKPRPKDKPPERRSDQD